MSTLTSTGHHRAKPRIEIKGSSSTHPNSDGPLGIFQYSSTEINAPILSSSVVTQWHYRHVPRSIKGHRWMAIRTIRTSSHNLRRLNKRGAEVCIPPPPGISWVAKLYQDRHLVPCVWHDGTRNTRSSPTCSYNCPHRVSLLICGFASQIEALAL